MKVIERVFERRIREKVKIDAMQFGFMPGKGITDAIAIFTVGQMQEKYGCKGKKLYFAFVDLEKAFDRVPREVTRWALRKAGVEEWLVKTVMAMSEGAQTVVRTTEGDSKAFNVKVGLHQGSVASPPLFVIVMEIISRELRAGLPLELLYADDLILIKNYYTSILQDRNAMNAYTSNYSYAINGDIRFMSNSLEPAQHFFLLFFKNADLNAS